MNKRIGGVIVLLLVVVGVSVGLSAAGRGGDGTSDGSASPVAVVEPNTVLIQDFAFDQPQLTVKKGTTVTWKNMDSARHDITPQGDAGDFIASELLTQGESYAHTFTTAGTYNYMCSPHPYMKGTIEVIE